MIYALLKRQLGFLLGSALRFFNRSIFTPMGIFFGCFQHRRRRRPDSSSSRSKSSETVLSKNHLSSLFLSEEKEDSSSNGRGNFCHESQHIDKQLKDEAKFLKACGTLPETPPEIRKASMKLKGSPPCDRDSESARFHSWLPSTSISKLKLDKEVDQPPTPLKLCEELRKDVNILEHTPSSSCMSNGRESGRTSISSTLASETPIAKLIKVPSNQLDTTQYTNKSVRFECDIDTASSKGSSSDNSSQHFRGCGSSGHMIVSKPLPNPTPLKLSDDMHTPGTVFPAKLANLEGGKPRIRSEYVFSVPNTVEYGCDFKEPKRDEPNCYQLSEEQRESLGSTPRCDLSSKQTLVDNDLKLESSLSSWLKPPSDRERRVGRTPGERPIIGLVAAHWNENEQVEISPKWWDGNGIPNSTNKYKEDQKVSWHATPFEERLEKALSEESFISERKHVKGRPIMFNECEESDTAVSELKPSQTQSKSVVSC